jgi:ubiquitin C-terminal hydrolase
MGSRRGVTLDQCLQTFTRPERLDENNKWYCNKCKDHVRAMKTMELWRLPNILIVHLKRFEFKHALRRDKLDTFVDFDVDGLDMAQYCGSSKNSKFVQDKVPAIYDLFGITNHFGRLGFGHYTAFARSWDEQKGMSTDWALFDDSSVRAVPAESVVTSAGYVLFYRRRQFS